MTKELEEKIKELEQERQSLTEALNKAESQITKWKYKFNLKNAEYILLYHELERYKKPAMNKWIIIGGIILACALVYYYSQKDKDVFYDAQEEL